MSSYQVIGDVGKTIVKLLREQLTPELIPKAEMIELCAPYEESDFRMTVYLYSVMENGISRDINNSTLSLNLFYLITPFSKAELKSKAYEESCILGRTMQIMAQNSILKGSALEGTLAEYNEEIEVALHSISTDEISKIWTFPNVAYKLSVAYMVGPVSIDIDTATATTVRRVIR